MKLIIAGSRDLVVDLSFITEIMDNFAIDRIQIKEVISGRAEGIDGCGELWAKEHLIPIVPFPANWYPKELKGKLDRSAGPKRNQQMAEYADAALIIMKAGGSRGSKNMYSNMIKLNKPIFLYEVE